MKRSGMILLAFGLLFGMGLTACSPVTVESPALSGGEVPQSAEASAEAQSEAPATTPEAADSSASAESTALPLEKENPPQPVIVVPGIGGDYMPEQNEQIKSLYEKALAAADELGYGEEDVLAAQAMEPGFRMAQILARRPEDWSYTVQISIYAQATTAEESFQALLDSGTEHSDVAGNSVMVINAFQPVDPDTGEIQPTYMASVREGNAIISCTEAEEERAKESLEALLAAK